MNIDSINNNTYIVDNGEIKADNIMSMIMREISPTHENTYRGSIFIDLPDEREIQCDFAMNKTCWHIVYNLLPLDTDEEKYGYGTVPLRDVCRLYDTNKTLAENRALDDEKKEVIATTLQKFLLDNKYKIAVI